MLFEPPNLLTAPFTTLSLQKVKDILKYNNICFVIHKNIPYVKYNIK